MLAGGATRARNWIGGLAALLVAASAAAQPLSPDQITAIDAAAAKALAETTSLRT